MVSNEKSDTENTHSTRVCPLCKAAHHVVLTEFEEEGTNLHNTRWRFTMHCPAENKTLIYTSYVRRVIKDIFFKRSDVVFLHTPKLSPKASKREQPFHATLSWFQFFLYLLKLLIFKPLSK